MTHERDERGAPLTRSHDSGRKEFDAVEARAGLLGKPVLRVLAVSLVLAFAVWGVVELWGERTEPVDDTQTSSTVEESQTPAGEEASGDPTRSETVPADRDPTPQTSTGGETQQTRPDGTDP